ncbi:MAG TPA: hypothetical protein VE817_11480 [Candidatus Acidoferrum sp.]|nr:hypothetical protein [Candidatus Acidoferrum sp.]
MAAASASGQRVEVVRGRLDAALTGNLVAFWTGHGVLDEATARARLGEVICVRLGPGGEVVGVNSAFPDEAPVVGRRFWIYRRFLSPRADAEAEREMLEAARAELERGFTGAPGEPVGLCVLVADRALIARRPEAVWPLGDVSARWPGGGLVFAGYTDSGVQVRVSYFEGARI